MFFRYISHSVVPTTTLHLCRAVRVGRTSRCAEQTELRENEFKIWRPPTPTTTTEPERRTSMEKVEEDFSKLRVAQRSAHTPEDLTYLLDIDCLRPWPEQTSPLLAASCSDRCVRVYDRQTLTLLRLFKGHSAPVSRVRFGRGRGQLFSASCDGTVRCWDARSQSPDAARTYRGFPGNAFLGFDISCGGTVLCAGTEKVDKDAFLVFWDARADAQEPLGVYSESHSDDITQVRFHPSDPDRMASGSTDGLVNVFDLGRDTEVDALLATCNSDSSVSFVGWSGEEGAQVFCTTHDEGFSLWDLTHLETEEPLALVRMNDARETTEIDGSALDYLIGGFYHHRTRRLLVLGGTHLGKLHFLSCEAGADGLTHLYSPRDAHSATVRAFYWDSEDESVVTAGEDAQLLLWKPGAVETSGKKKEATKERSSLQKKMRIHGGAAYKSKK
ncbi:WD repeat-containing protein 89 isoform X1 [Callorhinchus milii]|uniref:WD repeat-containing protein 89 isoform X1 n=2 Tax=Callorhinchus milii TaxID=7868 RepID=UPI001C3F99F3|nr:WD repeat-containing protein 89 isoform X1 [Callorhinchus milii]XP_007902037.2 WD repeat-containing protein 89 isoform X1 [Callorhinchus milii]XP_042193987.1 WD repeat-containing protein 89 isoform X1 [Callorhinchus milii]